MKKTAVVILVVLVILVGIRIYLPYWLTDYVNKVLDEVPEYKGSIEAVDLSLIRGAYKIHQLKMIKADKDRKVPFIDIETIDLSIQWSALFKGKVVGEIELIKPEINFVVYEDDAVQAGGEVDWTEPVKDLLPIQVNEFSVVDGRITYRDFSTDPKVNVFLDRLYLTVTNIGNVVNEQRKLPSSILLTAATIGEGALSLKAEANLLKRIPDFEAELKVENVVLPALNDFALAYAKLDFGQGIFNIYSEMAVADGALTGYVKPLMTNVKIVDQEDKDVLRSIWEAAAGLLVEIFENQSQDQFATSVPLKGDLNNVEAGIWPAIGNIFRNAFVEAFEKDVDETVSFEDIWGKD